MALKTFEDYDDTLRHDIVLGSLARLWQDGNDNDLPAAIASILSSTEQGAETVLRMMLEDISGEAGNT